MDFFDDGTANGGRQYSKLQSIYLLQELYARISAGNARKEELLFELRRLERDMADISEQIREVEAYSR